jgi:sulfur relay protein TusB/DsrH
VNAPNRNSSALHLVLAAGTGAFAACRARCAAGDSVLFLDDGVRQLLLGEPGKLLPPGVAVYYSQPDLLARGLAAPAKESRVRILQDEGFSALLESHGHCLSWK